MLNSSASHLTKPAEIKRHERKPMMKSLAAGVRITIQRHLFTPIRDGPTLLRLFQAICWISDCTTSQVALAVRPYPA